MNPELTVDMKNEMVEKLKRESSNCYLTALGLCEPSCQIQKSLHEFEDANGLKHFEENANFIYDNLEYINDDRHIELIDRYLDLLN